MSRLINIRFIRQNEKLAKNDDTMQIWSSDAQNFTVSFRSGDTKKSVITTMSDRAVFRLIRHTISLLEKDVDPFQFVQLDLPLMPSVLIKADELGASYNRILDAVEFNLDNWPLASTSSKVLAAEAPAPAPASAPVNTGFMSSSAEAETEDDEDEDTNDYSDMPGLISIDECQNHHHYPTRQAVRTHHMFLD